MAIQRVLPRIRHRVAFFRHEPSADALQAFRERKFLLEVAPCSAQELDDPAFLSGLAAVVFVQSPAKPLQIETEIRGFVRRLLDFECHVIIRPSKNGLTILTNILDRYRFPAAGLPRSAGELSEIRSPPLPHIRIFEDSVPWVDIANFVAENPPGKPPDPQVKLVVENQDTPFDEGRNTLMQRAFAGCTEVHLVRLPKQGNSGVTVYQGYAEIAARRWPMPYFVKIGDRDKVFDEFVNYEQHVDPYIPFHLGPHLISERCCLGAFQGTIVGDYVEEAESLCQCAGGGRAARAIACLFDHTLVGWHRSAEKKNVPLATGLHLPRKIPASRLARAKEFGSTRDLDVLKALFAKCTSVPVLVGPIHGDLHASNVLVRTIDAIVIDFTAYRDYPLVFDAACLEVGLLIEGFAGDGSNVNEWFKSVAGLYESIGADVAYINPKSPSYWFYACVRQIRRYAMQWECGPGQFAAALAAALLMKASKDADAAEPESSRRAAAYAFAERVLVTTFGP